MLQDNTKLNTAKKEPMNLKTSQQNKKRKKRLKKILRNDYFQHEIIYLKVL